MVLLKNQVLLLKTKNEQSVDKYEAILNSKNLISTLVRTLVFQFCNLEILTKKLNENEEYSGIIFSSPRCVQAVKLASEKFNPDLKPWKSKNNFAVGEATTSEALENLGLNCLGKDAGAAINLVKYILIDKSKYQKPFLYPHGSLKTDTLSREFQKENITLDGVLVYDTISNPNIEEEIKEATNNYQDFQEFLVFFSPSGFHSSLKYLKHSQDFPQAKIIAIGPTTESAIKEENLPIFAVAKQPTPEDILNIIIQ